MLTRREFGQRGAALLTAAGVKTSSVGTSTAFDVCSCKLELSVLCFWAWTTIPTRLLKICGKKMLA